jgi:ubiquinone/menaquinone biosynthesis C-methylase UbiE
MSSLAFRDRLRLRRFKNDLPVFMHLLDPKKADVVLDVGAGTGVITNLVANVCDDTYAVDPNPTRVEYIKQRYPQVKAFEGTAEQIPFPDSYFTKIYAISSFHHFQDKDAALDEFARLLKPDGKLLIRDAEPSSLASKFESMVSGLHFLKAEQLKEKLEAHGFSCKETRSAHGYFLLALQVGSQS